jgi:hypothetical protein
MPAERLALARTMPTLVSCHVPVASRLQVRPQCQELPWQAAIYDFPPLLFLSSSSSLISLPPSPRRLEAVRTFPSFESRQLEAVRILPSFEWFTFCTPRQRRTVGVSVFTKRTFMELLVFHGTSAARPGLCCSPARALNRPVLLWWSNLWKHTQDCLQSSFFHHVVAFMAMIRRRIFPFQFSVHGIADSLSAWQI